MIKHKKKKKSLLRKFQTQEPSTMKLGYNLKTTLRQMEYVA